MEAIKTARAEINAIVSQRRISEALERNITPVAERSYTVGKDVLVYSENKKGETRRPTMIGVDGRRITVKDKNNKLRETFNSFQVRPFYKEFTQIFTCFDLVNEKKISYKRNISLKKICRTTQTLKLLRT